MTYIPGTTTPDPTTTRGDLLVRGASSLTRLAMPTANKYFVSNGTDITTAGSGTAACEAGWYSGTFTWSDAASPVSIPLTTKYKTVASMHDDVTNPSRIYVPTTGVYVATAFIIINPYPLLEGMGQRSIQIDLFNASNVLQFSVQEQNDLFDNSTLPGNGGISAYSIFTNATAGWYFSLRTSTSGLYSGVTHGTSYASLCVALIEGQT